MKYPVNEKHARHFQILVTTLALTVACSAQTGSPDVDSSDPQVAQEGQAVVVAEIKSQDGTLYSFLQTGAGDIVLAVQAARSLDDSRLPSGPTNLVAFYERVAGHAAPDALVAAQAPADLLAQAKIGSFDQGAASAKASDYVPQRENVGVRNDALTAAQFQSMYCPSGYDFLYCWPNFWGNPWVQLTSYYLAGAVSPNNCTVRFRYRYYDDGWKTLVDRYASPGSYWWYYSYGGTRARRWEVIDNPPGACDQHFSVWGDY